MLTVSQPDLGLFYASSLGKHSFYVGIYIFCAVVSLFFYFI